MRYDSTAPAFYVAVDGKNARVDITADIIDAAFDYTVGMTSAVKIRILNVDAKYSDSNIFDPGREIDLYVGYAADPAVPGSLAGTFLGRGEIVRHEPDWPESGEAPTLTITAYDRSHRMKREELELKGGKGARPQRKRAGEVDPGRQFTGTVAEWARETFDRYGIVADVDPVLEKHTTGFLQRKGRSDYDVLLNLANYYDLKFWVDWVPASDLDRPGALLVKPPAEAGQGLWVGHLRSTPRSRSGGALTSTSGGQERLANGQVVRRYVYGTERASLISVEGSFSLPEIVTEIQAQVYNYDTGEYEVVILDEDKINSKADDVFSPLARGDDAYRSDGASLVRLSTNGHSIQAFTHPFRSPEEAKSFAQRFFNKQKDFMYTARFVMPGDPFLRAGEVHRFDGLGKRFSGLYYVSQVTQMVGTSGYRTECVGNRIVDEVILDQS